MKFDNGLFSPLKSAEELYSKSIQQGIQVYNEYIIIQIV